MTTHGCDETSTLCEMVGEKVDNRYFCECLPGFHISQTVADTCEATAVPTTEPTTDPNGKSINFLHDMQCHIDLIFSIHSLISTPYPGTHTTPVRSPHRGAFGTPASDRPANSEGRR
jgi:hypothetical protein